MVRRASFSPATSFRAEYGLTRHKNLRCFPQCGPEHQERHFCGAPVSVEVHGVEAGREGKGTDGLFVFGEFRAGAGATHVVGAACAIRPCGAGDNHFPGTLMHVKKTDKDAGAATAVYCIHAPRKWTCDVDLLALSGTGGAHTSSKEYVFSVVVCDTNTQTVLAVLDSPTFKLTPVKTAAPAPDSAPLQAPRKAAKLMTPQAANFITDATLNETVAAAAFAAAQAFYARLPMAFPPGFSVDDMAAVAAPLFVSQYLATTMNQQQPAGQATVSPFNLGGGGSGLPFAAAPALHVHRPVSATAGVVLGQKGA